MPEEIIRFTLFGQPYAKKNSQRTIFHKYLKRNIVVYSANYAAWVKDCKKQMNFKKCYKLGINFPINACFKFYVKDKRMRDISNYYEGIQDLMTEIGLIKDDNYTIIAGHDGSRMFYDKNNPRIEICLTKME